MNMHAPKEILSREYLAGFKAWLLAGGEDNNNASAALYEGAGPAGGYAVPITVAGQVIALAPQDSAVRNLATVIPTTGDIRFPAQAATGTVALKAESGASLNPFVDSSPAVGAFTLSAFMTGASSTPTMELLQDAPLFQAFLLQDAANDLLSIEEGLFLSGSGNGEAQGIIGNVQGITEEPDAAGNLVSIAGVWNLIDSLKEKYQKNAAFVMQRSTANGISKAQAATGGYPAFTRNNGQAYLFDYPVEFSAMMPAATRGAAPVLFGDIAAGYLVGDRGGPRLNVKVLDQALMTSGKIQILTFRRTDGRVRMPEAIQQYNIAAS